MKNLILIMTLLMSSVVFADTVDTRSFYFNGDVQSTNLQLNTEKTRTEYRQVQVPATCYRITYRRVCDNRPPVCRNVCQNGRCRRVCSGGGGQMCRDVQVRVPYSCMRYEQRAYEVHDYYVNTNVVLNFDLTGVDGGAAENFRVRVDGERAGLNVDTSKNYAIVMKNQYRQEARRGDSKDIDLTYELGFIKTKEINETLGRGIQNVSLKNGILRFSVGRGFNTQEFTQNIKVYRNRSLGSDILLFDRNLSENEMEINTNGSASELTIDLASLGIQVPSKTRVIMNTTYNLNGAQLLNPEDIKTEASANWVFSK